MVSHSIGRRVLSSMFARLSPAIRDHVATLVEQSYEAITYSRLAQRGFRPGGLIDVGAYVGGWTSMARATFGNPPAVMVEPQQKLIPALQQLAANDRNWTCAHALLASEAGHEVVFNEMGTGSSIFSEASNAPRTSYSMTTATLDEVAAAHLPDADDLFLKIDVQGAELEVLRGGNQTLARAALVQLEIALLPYNEGAPLLPEVVAWMSDCGWLPTEVSGFSRPRGQLVQIDMLFAPALSPLRPDYFRF